MRAKVLPVLFVWLAMWLGHSGSAFAGEFEAPAICDRVFEQTQKNDLSYPKIVNDACNAFKKRDGSEAKPSKLFLDLAFALEINESPLDAIVVYEEALEFDGLSMLGKYNVYNNLGLTHRKLENFDKALNAFDNAVDYSEDRWSSVSQSRYFKAETYRGMTRHAEAIVELTKVIERSPPKIEALMYYYSDRGNSYSMLGDRENAVSDYERALEIFKGERNRYRMYFYDSRCRSFYALGDYEAAKEDCRLMLNNKAYPKATLLMGYMYERDGVPFMARLAYEKAVELAPKDDEAQQALEAFNLKFPIIDE